MHRVNNALALCAGTANSQSLPKRHASLAQLELTMEVAATTEAGNPSALRVTVKNVGNVAVSMPMLRDGCHPDNGVQLESSWSNAGGFGGGTGGGCGVTDQPTMMDRAKGQWILLRPGEFMTTMLKFEPPVKEAETVEYWVQYTPPDATAREIEELLQAGYVIPTEKLETEHRSFVVH